MWTWLQQLSNRLGGQLQAEPDFVKRRQFFRALMSGLCVVLLTVGLTVQAAVDEVNLYNGKVVRGRINNVPQELILIRNELGTESSIRRIEVINRRDMVETYNHRVYYGSLDYVDSYKLHIRTDQGDVRLWRSLVKRITMGTPNEMRRMEGNKDTMIERHLGRNTLMQKTHLP